MRISYNRLWKKLIDLNMKKKELAKLAGLSEYAIGKLNRCENINVETLAKICVALNCTMDEIMEVIKEENEGKDNAR